MHRYEGNELLAES